MWRLAAASVRSTDEAASVDATLAGGVPVSVRLGTMPHAGLFPVPRAASFVFVLYRQRHLFSSVQEFKIVILFQCAHAQEEIDFAPSFLWKTRAASQL
jgi:hypothetical protein